MIYKKSFIEIADYSPSHLESIKEFRPEDSYAFRYLDNPRFSINNFLQQANISSTGLYKNKVLLLAAMSLLWPGVGEIWGLLDPIAVKYPLAVCKIANIWISYAINTAKLHRVQCKVIMGFYQSHLWVTKFLGFETEALLKKYGPNQEDYVQYVRI